MTNSNEMRRTEQLFAVHRTDEKQSPNNPLIRNGIAIVSYFVSIVRGMLQVVMIAFGYT